MGCRAYLYSLSKTLLVNIFKKSSLGQKGTPGNLDTMHVRPMRMGVNSPRLHSSLQTALLTLCYLALVIAAYRGEAASPFISEMELM